MSSLGVEVQVGVGLDVDATGQKHTLPQLPVEGGGTATVWRRDSVGARWIWIRGDGGCRVDRDGGRIE